MRLEVSGLLALIAAVTLSPAARAADAGAGRAVFTSSCSICHSAEQGKNKIGPSLFDITGRETGSVAGYSYSAANKAARLTWNDATLDRYLASPRTVIPGTKMTYDGLKDPTKRADLIAYLNTLK